MLDALALTGRSTTHVADHFYDKGNSFRAESTAAEAFLSLREAATQAGINLHVASAFRSFDQQLSIWQAKWQGRRVLLDAQGRALDPATLDDAARVGAILEWSALPGASRHHWGSDFDVFDKAAMPNSYDLQLIPSEYSREGIFAHLTGWLDVNMARFGFFRPYDAERGGVHPEPWHLSFAPVAVPALAALTPELVRDAIQAAEIDGKAAILAQLETIHACHICRVAVAPSFTNLS